jgi:ParB family chromosome partitioning protein
MRRRSRDTARRTTRKANGAAVEMPIADIIIGKRHRRDKGGIEALAASIPDIGLINAITIDEDGWLLAGARRLTACKLLGLQQVEVRTMRQERDMP